MGSAGALQGYRDIAGESCTVKIIDVYTCITGPQLLLLPFVIVSCI